MGVYIISLWRDSDCMVFPGGQLLFLLVSSEYYRKYFVNSITYTYCLKNIKDSCVATKLDYVIRITLVFRAKT